MAGKDAAESPVEGTAGHDIVVIGSSAGGVEALTRLVPQLPSDLAAAVLIVSHMPPDRESRLPRILERVGRLPVVHSVDGDRIVPGRVFVAPPDLHLLVQDHHVALSHGPKENLSRPAIDPLFRTAAVTYGPRVIGVLLSGLLDDGTEGLSAIKRTGGIAVVQDPNDALFADMPQSAIEHVQVDFTVPVDDMGPLLVRLVAEPAPVPLPVPTDLQQEATANQIVLTSADVNQRMGTPATVNCPECGGPVWLLESDGGTRFRCQIGHVYTTRALAAEQASAAERALWEAVVYLSEHARTLERIARSERARGHSLIASHFEDKMKEATRHVEQVKAALLGWNEGDATE